MFMCTPFSLSHSSCDHTLHDELGLKELDIVYVCASGTDVFLLRLTAAMCVLSPVQER